MIPPDVSAAAVPVATATLPLALLDPEAGLASSTLPESRPPDAPEWRQRAPLLAPLLRPAPMNMSLPTPLPLAPIRIDTCGVASLQKQDASAS